MPPLLGKSLPRMPTAVDLVDRQFTRSAANQLCVTDITEHPTRVVHSALGMLSPSDYEKMHISPIHVA